MREKLVHNFTFSRRGRLESKRTNARSPRKRGGREEGAGERRNGAIGDGRRKRVVAPNRDGGGEMTENRATKFARKPKKKKNGVGNAVFSKTKKKKTTATTTRSIVEVVYGLRCVYVRALW